MNLSAGTWLLVSLVSASQTRTPRESDVEYSFATAAYRIEMRVNSLAPYLGERLVFYSSADPDRPICPPVDGGTTGECLNQFVGAVALVKYTVKLANGGKPDAAAIRERVTVTAQSPGLLERAPFVMTLPLIEGRGSDIQAFGYDETPLKGPDHARDREQAKASWRLYRQELYIDEEKNPFAVVEWKHTVHRIYITRICSPPDADLKPAKAN
jgi:hypothetical protein